MKNLLSILVAFYLACSSVHALEKRPENLLLITADDMNWDSPGWMGNPLKLTPNLDALASTCHRIVHAHVVVAICQPSRHAIMTGMQPARSGGLGFNALNVGTPTLATVLRDSGYFVAAVNKLSHMKPNSCFPWDLSFDGSGKDPQRIAEDLARTIDAAKKSGKPFFINCNITDPHRKFAKSGQLTKAGITDIVSKEKIIVPSFLEDLPDVREEAWEYYMSIQRLDRSLGNIMKVLKDSGLEDQTVILFMSDHGMPMPVSKATTYYNGTRSPVILRWPGMSKPQQREEIVSSLDVAPTLLDLLKVPKPDGLDGVSWLPLLNGENFQEREFIVTQINDVGGGPIFPMRCIRTKKRALFFETWTDGKTERHLEAMRGLTFNAMAQAGRTDPRIQERVDQILKGIPVAFYDLEKDPDERVNRIDDPQYGQEIEQMKKLLIMEMEKLNDIELANIKTLAAGGTISPEIQKVYLDAAVEHPKSKGAEARPRTPGESKEE